MKKSDLQDLRGKKPEDLKKLLEETRKELAMAKLEHAMRKRSNVHEARDLKKRTAIIQTLIREKELNMEVSR